MTASDNSSLNGSHNTSGTPTELESASIGRSAALISFFVIISRITGFMRTWAMAFALGSTMLASSYQVANNLPNMLYELVMGGMLVTAFLPVYLSTKQKLGEEKGTEYASNLMSITFVILGLVALVCTLFAPTLIYTQSFMSDQSTMDDAIFFFRFFAIQIVFYGLSSIVSGLLNASRDYLWSSAAPIFNNVIVTVTFVLYAFVAPYNSDLALFIIAVGNPLGVFIQMAIQLPALKKNGIRLRFHINFKDPALLETLTIGIPAVLVMFAGLIIVSVQNAAAYSVADNGPSVIAYARLWYTLPYAFLTVPITTALFTEISDMYACNNIEGFKKGVVSGTNQILYFMIPFAMYLIVFSVPLVTLYHIGAFTAENINQIALYVAVLAISLPFYSVNTYLQKIFSALRAMKQFALMAAVCAVIQIAFTLIFATSIGGAFGVFGLGAIAFGETVYYVLLDLAAFMYLRKHLGCMGLRSTLQAFVVAILLGLAGAAVGAALMALLSHTVLPLNGSIAHALIIIILGGATALSVTYGLSILCKVPQAEMIVAMASRVKSKLTHR